MGKRNKSEQKNNTKVKKKRSNSDENGVNINDDATEVSYSTKTSSGNGKNKKIVFDNEEASEMLPEIKTQDKQTPKLRQRIRNKATESKIQVTDNNVEEQNEKIIFEGDKNEPPEVSLNKNRNKKNKECDNGEPKDEEIDKFCDELDEEDNVHYDNWVKLIEAKLGPNKK